MYLGRVILNSTHSPQGFVILCRAPYTVPHHSADPGVASSNSHLGHITFVEIDNEIISAVGLSLSLIQDGQMSVTSKSICTKYCLIA